MLKKIFSIINQYPSLLGFTSLIIWSFSALIASEMGSIPIFEMLVILFFVSSVAILLKIAIYNQWYKLKQPYFLYIIGVAGIYGNDFFYFEAFKHAPATQVDLINYLWPILVVLFSTFLISEKVHQQQLFGCLLSFFGVYVLIAYDRNIAFNTSYLIGYLYAFCDAVIWALYLVVCRRYHKFDSEVIGVYCLIGLIISIIGHLSTETFIMPSLKQFLGLCAIGFFSQAMAYMFWEKAIKRGNFILLSISSYFTPVASIALLILCSKAKYSNSLLIATLLVALGAFLAGQRKQNLP